MSNRKCPFCGGDGELTFLVDFYWVECRRCGASAPGHDTAPEAYRAWNHRHQERHERHDQEAAAK